MCLFSALPSLFAYGIWWARSIAIFQIKLIPPEVTMALVVQWTRDHKSKYKEPTKGTIVPLEINKEVPWDFFDGASQGDPPLGGSGGVIYFSDKHKVQENFSPGHCTNNKEELAALHTVLNLAININISQLQVFGDSKMVIDWVNRNIQINSPHLQQLLRAIKRILEHFTGFNITHIYRELDMEADGMAKQALLLALGNLET